MTHIILFLFVICWVCPVFGETFQWVDEGGRVHFADDFTKIPEKYRAGTVRIENEDRKISTDEKQMKGEDDNVKDWLGRGEDYWRKRVAEVKNNLKSLLDKSEDLRIKHDELTTRYNDSRTSVERAAIKNERDQIRQEIEKNKAEIEEMRKVLEKKIPEEAELYRAKPEWIK